MQLISVGNVILNLDRISVLDMDQELEGNVMMRVFTDSEEPIIEVSVAPEVPDLLLNLVPQKMRFVGVEVAP